MLDEVEDPDDLAVIADQIDAKYSILIPRPTYVYSILFYASKLVKDFLSGKSVSINEAHNTIGNELIHDITSNPYDAKSLIKKT